MRHRLALPLLAAALSLTACAGRPGNDVLQTVAAPAQDVATTVEVLAVATRERENPRENAFTAARKAEPNYAAFSIAIPPGHRAGEIEWPQGRPDPSTNFAVVEQSILSRRAFLERALRDEKADDIVLFVHGYNQSFPEALFRQAQMVADSGIPSTSILFSWPSLGTLGGYLADLDSAAFSRDALAATLRDLAAGRRNGRITLVAHSLGSWLTMEALRQLRLTGEDGVLSRLDVVLAAPDIDVDLFERQASVVGPLDPPLTVLVSADDQALLASGRLSASHRRLGALDVDDPKVQEIARRTSVAIIDVSQIRSVGGLNHNRLAALASLAGSLEDEAEGAGGIRQAGAFVFDAVGRTISSPFTLVGQALAGQ